MSTQYVYVATEEWQHEGEGLIGVFETLEEAQAACDGEGSNAHNVYGLMVGHKVPAPGADLRAERWVKWNRGQKRYVYGEWITYDDGTRQ